MEKLEYKTLTLEQMIAYIDKNAPKDKQWFKGVATQKKIDKEGNEYDAYDHFKAREEFCKKYMPDIIPVAKPKKPTKAEILANW